ncbi:MAG: aminoglycoside phosphotransferase family protein [Deltaproteobacteria bacterium]|nr:aminoglycoside phosphotransferase family protein [Deltaproteobacteria bacterium]
MPSTHPDPRRIESSRGFYYLKRYPSKRKLRQETRFLDRVQPHLQGLVPEVLLSDEHELAVLMTGLAGDPFSRLDLPRDREVALFHSAGWFLSQLHAIDVVDDDELTIAEGLRMRAAALAHAVGAETRSLASFALEQLSKLDLSSELRVPCHRDFDPRNWLVDGSMIRVVDFEHARLDARVADVTRLWTLVFPGRDELEAAFFAGYGRRFPSGSLLAMAALDAAATLSWATRHGDPEFLARGRRMAKRVEECAPPFRAIC